MDRTVGMLMTVEVNAFLDQAIDHMRAEPEQHRANRSFQDMGDTLRIDRATEDQRTTRQQNQRYGMPQTPGRAVSDDAAKGFLPRGDGGNGGNVIRLHGMLHANHKASCKNC